VVLVAFMGGIGRLLIATSARHAAKARGEAGVIAYPRVSRSSGYARFGSTWKRATGADTLAGATPGQALRCHEPIERYSPDSFTTTSISSKSSRRRSGPSFCTRIKQTSVIEL